MADFVAKLRSEGEITRLPAVMLKLTGFPADSTDRSFAAPVTETGDGVSRNVEMVFSENPSSEGAIPIGLFWLTRRIRDRESESYLYRTALDGTLEKAFMKSGETDETGADINGKSKLTKLDVGDAKVHERFHRDVLDFWLKGKGRKRGGARPPKKSSKH